MDLSWRTGEQLYFISRTLVGCTSLQAITSSRPLVIKPQSMSFAL